MGTRYWKVEVVETGAVVGTRIERAATALQRMRGLLGRTSLLPGEGMLIEDTASIHMFFMLFSIDCVFLDKDYTIQRIARRVPPFGMASCYFPRPASHTLEIPAGIAKELSLQPGQHLRFSLNA
mgnify:CR=1 FL=1